ncbi:MAG: monofunctional biosynthetic peptidoglycan transglycosylase [Rhodoferax sp.]|nr:monofunctional biosynthetic peptidoglycan transglycosylase [Rhodoferax sp.]
MKPLLRWVVLVGLAILALQLFFVLRIAAMAAFNPQSTAFERSEAWRLATQKPSFRWRQQWRDYPDISNNLKRAVIASEDDGFVSHQGVDWGALEKAWKKNAQVEARSARKAALDTGKGQPAIRPPKVVGGSTITQQLAKNLFLSGERTLLRKGQEMVLTLVLEALLSKQRILEIYLNSVEWGEGVFGAEAAAQHYFRKSASQLSPWEAARLAAMLPRPKHFEKLPQSAYLSERANTLVTRMPNAELP